MRKSRTVHLEEDFWREMDEYKELNTCGSRNTALERMLLERRMLINLIQQIGLSSVVGNTTQTGFGFPAMNSQSFIQPATQPTEPTPVPEPKVDKKTKAKRGMLFSAQQGMKDE